MVVVMEITRWLTVESGLDRVEGVLEPAKETTLEGGGDSCVGRGKYGLSSRNRKR